MNSNKKPFGMPFGSKKEINTESNFEDFKITPEEAKEIKGGMSHELADVDMGGISSETCKRLSPRGYSYSESGGYYVCRDSNGTVVGTGKV